MKLKELLLPLALALTVIWGGQLVVYFATKNSETEATTVTQVKSGQSFVVPSKEQLIKPLMLDVEYASEDKNPAHNFFTVTTDRLIVTFDMCGGTIAKMTSKRVPGIEEQQLTFFTTEQLRGESQKEFEKYAFLVALNGQTPLTYALVSNVQEAGVSTVVLRSVAANCTIEKVFKIMNGSYKVDVTLVIDPQGKIEGDGILPRLLLPAPYIAPVAATGTSAAVQDTIQGVVLSDSDTLERKKPELLEDRLWGMPTLFGAEDRYFLHALVADPAHFVQRAYYKISSARAVTCIFEGPLVHEKSSWNLSFYCGPKQINELALVDSRLEPILDYGWLGPIAKAAMMVLRFLYSYVKNYGIAIILLTVLMKLLLLPLTFRMEKSAQRAVEMKKKLQYLEQKYKDDPEQLKNAKADLVRKHGLFDVGCLSVFAQIPLLLGLNRALSTSIELYKAPFFGWITDLSALDPWHVLPACVGLGMFVHSGRATDPRQRLVTVLMALVIGGIMTNLAAGLVLFIAVSTWTSIIQSRLQKAFKV